MMNKKELDELLDIHSWMSSCGCHCCINLDKKILNLINNSAC